MRHTVGFTCQNIACEWHNSVRSPCEWHNSVRSPCEWHNSVTSPCEWHNYVTTPLWHNCDINMWVTQLGDNSMWVTQLCYISMWVTQLCDISIWVTQLCDKSMLQAQLTQHGYSNVIQHKRYNINSYSNVSLAHVTQFVRAMWHSSSCTTLLARCDTVQVAQHSDKTVTLVTAQAHTNGCANARVHRRTHWRTPTQHA